MLFFETSFLTSRLMYLENTKIQFSLAKRNAESERQSNRISNVNENFEPIFGQKTWGLSHPNYRTDFDVFSAFSFFYT